MKKKLKAKGGFSYHFDREKILWWMSVPPAKKLEWIELINKFLHQAMPRESKEIMEKFRKGEI